MSIKRILLMNGPNLDMLGVREPDVYGADTLEDLEWMVTQYAAQHGIEVVSYQSNSEAKLVGKIHKAMGLFDGIVYNPGAHTHYSYALRDAIKSIDVPVVEVHISDVDAREPFRSISVTAPACVAQVKGLGFGGYCRAIDVLVENPGLERLGEGYAEKFPSDEHILISSNAGIAPQAVEAPEADAVVEQQEEPKDDLVVEQDITEAPLEDAHKVALAQRAVDYAAAFEGDAFVDDAGFVSRTRRERLCEACGRMGLDAFFARDTFNIAWLTLFDGVFDEESAHSLLVMPGQTYLHTDRRYSNAMREASDAIQGGVDVQDDPMAHARFAKQVFEAASLEGCMGIEDTISYAEFAKTVEQFGAPRLRATTDLIRGMRAVKAPFELARMKAAQAVTDAAFLHIVDFMKPGMTEREVQLELEDFMLRHGGEGIAFRSIVAAGANGADPHAVPGSTRLEAGQCVVLDFGAKAYGYCADMTRTVFLGEPTGKMADAWKALRRANEEVESMLRPGVTGREAHLLAENVLEECGFGGKMGHGLGHGVGLEIHELPVLNPRNDKALVEGNVVTVEPGIYLPGEFGMRLEDCGVITSAGYEPFSQLGHEMVVI